MKRIAVPFLAVLLAAAPGRTETGPGKDMAANTDELRWRKDFRDNIHNLFVEKNFAELDRIAETCRQGERTPSGLWKLDVFYSGLCLSGIKSRESFWELYLNRFREWREQRPESVTALIGLAEAWIEYAWYARGGGWAHTVTETGWKLFRERMEQAERILVDNCKECSVSPRWHGKMILLARTQGWGRFRAWELLKASAEAFPDYFESYFQMAILTLPRWSGMPGEWAKMANWAGKKIGGDLGKEIYTRICWTIWGWEKDRDFLSPEARVSWDQMKAGFEVMDKKYPGSTWNRAAFCYFAWLFRDRPTVRGLLPELDGRLALKFWRDRKSLDKTRAWAEENGKESD